MRSKMWGGSMSFDLDKVEITPVDELPKPKKEKDKPEKPKKKPTYSVGRYAKNPVCKVVNKGITDAANTYILKDKKKKMERKDCEVGEALMYMIEYYTAIDVKHPALIMLSAVMGVTFIILELNAGEDIGTTKPKTPDDRIDPELVAK